MSNGETSEVRFVGVVTVDGHFEDMDDSKVALLGVELFCQGEGQIVDIAVRRDV